MPKPPVPYVPYEALCRTLTVEERARRERFIELVSQGMPGVKAAEMCGWSRFEAHEVADALMAVPYIRSQVVGNLQVGVVQMRALFARAKAVLFQNMDFDNPDLKPSDRQAAAATVIATLLKSGKPLSDAAEDEDKATMMAKAVDIILGEIPDGAADVRDVRSDGERRAGGGEAAGAAVLGVPAELGVADEVGADEAQEAEAVGAGVEVAEASKQVD